MATEVRRRKFRALTTGLTALAALSALVMAPATATASPGAWSAARSPAAAPPGPEVNLNDYCPDRGADAHLADGRTVYCTPVQGTDALVWSYSRGPLTRDPNTRGYTCDDGRCRFPDGSDVPGYQRCGILCGEPPTSGDVQSGLADCFEAGTPFEECERRIR